MKVALLLLHKDSMAAVFDSSVAAGARVFRWQRIYYLGCNEQGFVPLSKFDILCITVSDFCCSAVGLTPSTKACSHQFLGFSLVINFQAKVPVMCLDNTYSVSVWVEDTGCTVFLLLYYRLSYLQVHTDDVWCPHFSISNPLQSFLTIGHRTVPRGQSHNNIDGQ